jgi:outer membrane protein
MKLLQSLIASTAMVAAFAGAALAQDAVSADSKFLLRSRAVYVAPSEKGTTDAIGGDVSLDDSIIPEIDLTYFITKNIGVEAIAAVTPHNASVANSALGNVDLGSVVLLPPTVNLQYHFNPEGKFRPYIGAGVNYTIFLNEHAGSNAVVNKVEYDNSFGYSFQAGVDYMLNDKMSLNLDVKKIKLDTDVTVNNAIHSSVDIDPLLIGVGVGYRF